MLVRAVLEKTSAFDGFSPHGPIVVRLSDAPDPARESAYVKVNASTITGEEYVVSGGSDNHLILVDLTSKGLPGKVAAKALDKAGLELNYNTVPFDPRKPFDPSGVRLGTPAVTSRGMKEREMETIAAWIDEVIASPQDAGRKARIVARESCSPTLSPQPSTDWYPLRLQPDVLVIVESERGIFPAAHGGGDERRA